MNELNYKPLTNGQPQSLKKKFKSIFDHILSNVTGIIQSIPSDHNGIKLVVNHRKIDGTPPINGEM